MIALVCSALKNWRSVSAKGERDRGGFATPTPSFALVAQMPHGAAGNAALLYLDQTVRMD